MAAPFAPDAVDRALAVALAEDGRAPYADLAAVTVTGPDSARRRVGRMPAGRVLTARCEIARSLSEWPVAMTLWVRVASGDMAKITPIVSGMREVRLCVGVSGRYNLMITAWIRSVGDAQRFEARLAERLPGILIGDRATVLQPMKLMGHLLDHRGHRIGTVPVNPWSS
ncbi:DNA-binding Lrp family transcriptional regulator [Spinactinospora alkalitolerans]|uniref:DNA-binding Lrp family transcriptional regulator n=1 Tax=Spinactinospora alkalitolerans TaxID=687207 RepID=A0A852U4F8_9ACTN|nr:Lrp/AsnC family transcriptional regulator [Spinactinospora alkalitolerans]NYE50395.1 DNA-binding Lrp family transcriptional regulator [Spinactinospora alkalitolerans]